MEHSLPRWWRRLVTIEKPCHGSTYPHFSQVMLNKIYKIWDIDFVTSFYKHSLCCVPETCLGMGLEEHLSAMSGLFIE
jgi:hypothetical protein